MDSSRNPHRTLSYNSMRGSQIPHRVPSYRSLGSDQIPKQYRVLGLEQEEPSIVSDFNHRSTTTATLAAPPSLGDHLHIIVENITLYFNLFHNLPYRLIDRNLQLERPIDTFNAFHHLEVRFSRCLLVLRDTFWATQTQMKDENGFVRKIFRGFEDHIKKYLTRCLKGWKTTFLARSFIKHYRTLSRLRRVLRKELAYVKEIMDAVGPHCRDMLLEVDIEVIEKWMANLDEPRMGRAGLGLEVNIFSPQVTKSEKLVRTHRPTYSTSWNQSSGSEKAKSWRFSRGIGRRRSTFRASSTEYD